MIQPKLNLKKNKVNMTTIVSVFKKVELWCMPIDMGMGLNGIKKVYFNWFTDKLDEDDIGLADTLFSDLGITHIMDNEGWSSNNDFGMVSVIDADPTLEYSENDYERLDSPKERKKKAALVKFDNDIENFTLTKKDITIGDKGTLSISMGKYLKNIDIPLQGLTTFFLNNKIQGESVIKNAFGDDVIKMMDYSTWSLVASSLDIFPKGTKKEAVSIFDMPQAGIILHDDGSFTITDYERTQSVKINLAAFVKELHRQGILDAPEKLLGVLEPKLLTNNENIK